MLHAVDRHPLPGVLLDLDASPFHRSNVVDEVQGEVDGVVLDLPDALLLRVGEAGVLLGIGRKYPCLVALEVGGCEVTTERGRDADIADLVPWPVTIDPHDSVFGFAVLVVP